MNQMLSMCRAAACVCVMSGLAHGQFEYVSQTRSVGAGTDGPNESFESMGLGLFNESAYSEYPPGSAIASATQTSTLAPFSMTATGGSFADAINAFFAGSDTIFDVTFSITSAVEFWFEGEVFTAVGSDVGLSLTGPDDIEPFRLGFNDDFTDFVNSDVVHGILQPGEYTFYAIGRGYSGGDFDGAGGFDFEFTIAPTPGASAFLVGCLFMTRRRRA